MSDPIATSAKGIAQSITKTVNLPSEWLDELVRYFYARLGNLEEAQDAAIEVWQDANRKSRKVQAADNPKAFLFGMAGRKAVDCFRRLKRQRRSVWTEPDARPEHDLNGLLVDEVLQSLSDDYREVLVLKYVHGFDQTEVAQLMGRSVPAVNSLLQRARESFRTVGSHLEEIP